MTVRLLHTADWQIGKRFGFVPEEGDKAAALRLERFEAVERIARLAAGREVDAVLVAGDVFEHDALSDETLRRTVNRMSAFPGIWVLLPGNHDPAFSENIWSRLARPGQLPPNILLATQARPLQLLDGRLTVLPAPLQRRHEFRDLTEWFDEAPSTAGSVRVGLAHGSVRNRLPEGSEAKNLISDARADSAGLDYLALGDWHGTMEIAPRTWYSGTPEADRFHGNDPGNVLSVEIDAAGAAPRVTRERTGRFLWRTLQHALHGASDIEALDSVFHGLGEPRDVLVKADLAGNLDLADRQQLQEILDAWAARFHCMIADDTALGVDPSEEDLATFNAAGFVGEAAQALRERMAPGSSERETAREALRILFSERAKLLG